MEIVTVGGSPTHMYCQMYDATFDWYACTVHSVFSPCVSKALDMLLPYDLQYYAECHGVIYVVDSSDSENLAISSQTFSMLLAIKYIIVY